MYCVSNSKIVIPGGYEWDKEYSSGTKRVKLVFLVLRI